MLDYDSMRSKVKKLTEKPDKDPSKLPRTEKEADMVNTPLLFQDIPSPAKDVDFFPISSPPKALDGLRRTPLLLDVDMDPDEDAAIRSVGANNLRRSSSLYRNVSRVSSLVSSALSRSPSFGSPGSPTDDMLRPPPSPPVGEISGSWQSSGFNMPPVRKPVGSPRSPATLKKRRVASIPESPTHRPARLIMPEVPTYATPQAESYRAALEQDNILITPSISITPANVLKNTPFFHPSELEDIMAPLRKEFVLQQTDLCVQAKAAYEQLNQQLTDELPQLIDLRYDRNAAQRLRCCSLKSR